MRLKSATSSVTQFGTISLCATIRDAAGKLGGSERIDVIFISFKIDRNDLIQFIKDAKATKCAEDAAYVLVLGGQNQDATTVATTVMLGGDGFLFEPYSVDQLVEITNLAAKVRKERADTREKMAISMIVQDLMKQIDLLAYLRALGYESGSSTKKFKEKCQFVTSLSPENLAIYYDLAIQLFSDAPLPSKALKPENYKGVSSRVKKKMAEKVIAEVEKASE